MKQFAIIVAAILFSAGVMYGIYAVNQAVENHRQLQVQEAQDAADKVEADKQEKADLDAQLADAKARIRAAGGDPDAPATNAP